MNRVACVIPIALLTFALIGNTRGGGTHNANPEYWSFVVFGDLQRMSDDYRTGGPTEEGYAELGAAVDWIFANKDRERIEFVMAVGDLINSAVALPPDGSELSVCDGEDGAPYTASSATCFTHYANEANCKAEPGCFWSSGLDGDGAGCGSCDLVERAETEWTGFDALWARFSPGGDTTYGIPALLVRGNHDNVGTENATDTDREPLGWNDRYGASYWSSLAGRYRDRHMEFLGSYTDSTTGNNYAWAVKVGGRRIIVVSIACCVLAGVPDDAEAWALAMMDLYSDLPAIVLTHHANAIETIVVDSADTDAPNLFAYFGGHDGDRAKTIRTIGAESIVRSETDWTEADATPANDHDENGVVQNDYFTLVRLHLNSDEIEIFDYSAEGLAKNTKSTNRLTKQSFSID